MFFNRCRMFGRKPQPVELDAGMNEAIALAHTVLAHWAEERRLREISYESRAVLPNRDAPRFYRVSGVALCGPVRVHFDFPIVNIEGYQDERGQRTSMPQVQIAEHHGFRQAVHNYPWILAEREGRTWRVSRMPGFSVQILAA